MDAQAELGKILGSVTSGVSTALKIGKSIGGKDLDMANRARENLKQKIEATKQNRGASAKIRAKLDVGGEK